ncbi:hypothetical protein MPNT_10178 [Candidatus Methylacidithermus pantelleriae]|uniref:Uncharacterized protein n=1 Tax=Candidatus Methylacidithermus pantelleriae TaxID=2744239 RepID=A0A8J2FN22_9BACT|nr:hypothetical protein MPNT_10178 [Candidatus Methylacidithermus pantelleriae]
MWIVKAVKEVGSARKGDRTGLLAQVSGPKVAVIRVEHCDRLMRFGFE